MPSPTARIRPGHAGRGRRFPLATVLAASLGLGLPARAEVPAEQALVLAGRTRSGLSSLRGLAALKRWPPGPVAERHR